MTTYFTQIEVKIGAYQDVERPELNQNKSFYSIYSPETFTLRPRDRIFLDLKITVDAPERLEVWINLLPCLKERGLIIEDHKWTTNKLKDNTIQLDILNKNFYNTTTIKKDQELGYMFLLGQKFNESINTKYNTIT